MRKHIPLMAILGVAVIARFWAIDFCLPTLVCRPDEEAVASVATGPERAGSIYDRQDEFFVPLAGIDHLEPPGPRITVLTRR